MPLNIIRNTITAVKADAIVNSANPDPVAGGGAEGHIYAAAGYEKLLKARQKIGKINEGETAVTPAFALSAKYIIHTVSPVWIDGKHNEAERLRSCYRNALRKAEELKCTSIAFPLLATGRYSFPKEMALLLAREEITSFLKTVDMDVILAVYDPESFRIASKLQEDIRSYIDEHSYVSPPLSYMKLPPQGTEKRRRRREPSVGAVMNEAIADEGISLKDIMDHTAETFSEMLLRMIDERELKDTDVYKKANVDRKLFSKIRSNASYHPKKNTVLAFALALKLSLDETKDLLERAGYALSPSSRADLIIQYCIEHKMYDIYEVNEVLFQFEQPGLGV